MLVARYVVTANYTFCSVTTVILLTGMVVRAAVTFNLAGTVQAGMQPQRQRAFSLPT
jgi:hypothetical protein